MMTCRECIHHLVCAVYAPNFDDILANGESCSEFKNKANFVEVSKRKMTTTEYREKHPNCKYCKNWMCGDEYGYECSATRKRMFKRTAKKCPCYAPEKWRYD